MYAVFLQMHSIFPRRSEALGDTARQNDCGSLKNVKRNARSLSPNVKAKRNKNQTTTKTVTTEDPRRYCFPSIFLGFILHTQRLTWEWKPEEFLGSSEHWHWLTSETFLSETPCIIFSIEGLKDSRKEKWNFIVWGVCLFIKILVTPNLSCICSKNL